MDEKVGRNTLNATRIAVGIGIIFILLGIFIGYYSSKYRDAKDEWFAEMTERRRLERQVDRLQSELSATKQELSAKENMLEIYQQNLDFLKEKLSAMTK